MTGLSDERPPDPAGFRTVTDVASDWSIADLRAQLGAAPTQYVAHLAADGSGRARRVDAALDADLNVLDDAAPADRLFAIEHVVHVEQQIDVDSAYRARRILAGRTPERILLVIDGSAVVALFSLDTASAVTGPETVPSLRWVTDMPSDASLMANRVLLLGSTPWLRTRITDALDAEGHATTIDVAALRDRKISFGFVGRNIGFRLPDEVEVRPAVDSDYLDPLGPDASWSVQLVPLAAGPASVDVEIWFDDDENFPHPHHIDFTVVDVASSSVGAVASAAVADVAEIATPFAVPPEASVWIRWDGDELVYDVDGVTDRHPVAASIGEFEGAELRTLIAEIERVAATYVADDVTAGPADGGAALLGFAQVGARLHAMVYGKDEFDVGDEVADRAKFVARLGTGLPDRSVTPPRLRVEDERLRLPWELFYDHGYARAVGSEAVRFPRTVDEVDVTGFWGRRFRIDHPVARGDRAARSPGDHLLAEGPPRVTPFIHPAIAGDPVVDQRLVALNQALLDALVGLGSQVDPVAVDLPTWVASGTPTDVLYLYGHGHGATAEDALGREQTAGARDQARLSLGHDDVSIADLEAVEPTPPHLPGAPLVLLNACSTLHGDLGYRNPFVDLFCRRWRARALVGGLAPLPASFAVEFASRFLTRFASGDRQLGDCLHATVCDLLDEGNPFGLLYALHGRSELQVRSAR